MMNKYKIWCVTDQKWEEVISSTTPTECPIDSLHTVDSNSAVIIEKEIKKLDGSPENLTLDEYKSMKYGDIDRKTGELISQGFTYLSNQFSLSSTAQHNLNGLEISKDLLTYPVEYNTIDDTGVYQVVDATDMHNMYLAALTAKKGHLDSGSALKSQVRVSTDKAGVDAVIDNR